MAEQSDVVLSGKYEGSYLFVRDGRAYIRGEQVEMSKKTVKEVAILGTKGGPTGAGALYGGVVGAVVASNMKSDILEVTWKDDEKSVISCSQGLAETILASPYKSSLGNSGVEKAYRAEENARKIDDAIWGIVVIGWIIYFGIYSILN